MAGRALGQPVGIRLEDGSQLSLTQSLADAGLKDQQHVWVVFKAMREGGGGGKPAGGMAAADVDEDDLM